MSNRKSSREKSKPQILTYNHLMTFDKVKMCRKKKREQMRAKEGMRKTRMKKMMKSRLNIKVKKQKKK